MAENWDTKTAKNCKIKDVLPESCRKCRDFDFCQKNRQISIDEYLKQLVNEWKPIQENAKIEFPDYAPILNHIILRTQTPQKVQNVPDVTMKGTVNGIHSNIGFKKWVSGPNDCYIHLQPIQYKEIQK